MDQFFKIGTTNKGYPGTLPLKDKCQWSGPMSGAGVSHYISLGSGEPRRAMWISEGPHSLSHISRPSFHYITYIYSLSGPNFASSCLKPVCPWGHLAVLLCLAKYPLEVLSVVLGLGLEDTDLNHSSTESPIHNILSNLLILKHK